MNYVVLLGGNIGDRESYLENALTMIKSLCGSLVSSSSLYESKAWGKEDQKDFLNQVIVVNSELSPERFLETILAIEKDLGRVRYKKWGERVIDIDILYVDDLVINTKFLKVPHPFIQDRRFTLVPLTELVPDFTHPILSKTQVELLLDCKDELEVKKK